MFFKEEAAPGTRSYREDTCKIWGETKREMEGHPL